MGEGSGLVEEGRRAVKHYPKRRLVHSPLRLLRFPVCCCCGDPAEYLGYGKDYCEDCLDEVVLGKIPPLSRITGTGERNVPHGWKIVSVNGGRKEFVEP